MRCIEVCSITTYGDPEFEGEKYYACFKQNVMLLKKL